MILVNSGKGQKMLDTIRSDLVIETASLEDAKRGQKCLSEPFRLPEEDLKKFWEDYSVMSLSQLCKKYCPNKYVRPSNLWVKHIKDRFRWIVRKGTEVSNK